MHECTQADMQKTVGPHTAAGVWTYKLSVISQMVQTVGASYVRRLSPSRHLHCKLSTSIVLLGTSGQPPSKRVHLDLLRSFLFLPRPRCALLPHCSRHASHKRVCSPLSAVDHDATFWQSQQIATRFIRLRPPAIALQPLAGERPQVVNPSISLAFSQHSPRSELLFPLFSFQLRTTATFPKTKHNILCCCVFFCFLMCFQLSCIPLLGVARLLQLRLLHGAGAFQGIAVERKE